MSQADETASSGQAGEGVDRAAQLMRRMDATQPTATFKKVMALTSAGVFVDAMDVYLAGGVKSTLAETGFATNEQTAAFLSAGFLGLFIGSLIAGLIGDKLGRRKAFQFNLLLFGFATILGALSPNMTFMIAMRFFVGLGLGSELVTSFSMINEFAPRPLVRHRLDHRQLRLAHRHVLVPVLHHHLEPAWAGIVASGVRGHRRGGHHRVHRAPGDAGKPALAHPARPLR